MDARIDCCGATVEIVPYCKSRPIVDPGGSRSQGDACASDNRGPYDGPEVCPLAFLASEDAVFGRLSPALIRTVLLREPRVQSGPTPLGLFRYCTAKLMATAFEPQSQAIHIDADDRGYVQGQQLATIHPPTIGMPGGRCSLTPVPVPRGTGRPPNIAAIVSGAF